MMARLLTGIAAAALLLSLPAAAADQEALKLILKQNPATGRGKVVWVTKNPPPVLPAQPPTSVGGAFVVTGVDEQVSAPLPAADWKPNPAGTLYKFVNKAAPGGDSPCKVALIKTGKVLKVVCKDSLIDLDDGVQGTVAVALTIGNDTYCSVCTTAVKDAPGVFIAKGCSAPVDCSAAVPTTSTTTSTSLPPVCGNGVIEGSEQCDGTQLGICEDLCFPPGEPQECTCCTENICLGFVEIPCCPGFSCHLVVPPEPHAGGVCLKNCTQQTDCPPTQACTGGFCSPFFPPCSQPADCTAPTECVSCPPAVCPTPVSFCCVPSGAPCPSGGGAWCCAVTLGSLGCNFGTGTCL
jgi:hypothetical protein